MAAKKITTPVDAPVDAPATPVAAPATPIAAPATPIAAPAVAVDAPAEVAVEVAVEVAAEAPPTAADNVSALIKQLEASLVIAKEHVNALKQSIKVATQAHKVVSQVEKEKGRRAKGRAAKAAAAAVKGGAAVEGGAPASRKPSGFATPAILSAQLSEFLGVPEGTKMARTDVTRLITEYVKKNQLHDTADKRIIKSDDKLKQILGGNDDKPLTYFNLQTHIKHHFIKAPVPVAVPVPVPVPIAV